MDKSNSKPHKSINMQKSYMGKSDMGAPMGKPDMGSPMDNAMGKPDMGAPMDNAMGKPDMGAPMDNAMGKPDMGAPMDNAMGKPDMGAPMDNAMGKPDMGAPMDNAMGKSTMDAPKDIGYKVKQVSKDNSIYDFNSNMKDGFDPMNKPEMNFDLFDNQKKQETQQGPPQFDMSTINSPKKPVMDVTGRVDKTPDQQNPISTEKKEENLQYAFDVSNKFAPFDTLEQKGGKKGKEEKDYVQPSKNEIVYDVDINGLGNKVNGNDNTKLYYELS